ncbi:MAG: hypothetical protein NZX77_05340, partial [Polyangiaceae bacterium]|nr:hypothetical protein [Polyangiaceae bacterium]
KERRTDPGEAGTKSGMAGSAMREDGSSAPPLSSRRLAPPVPVLVSVPVLVPVLVPVAVVVLVPVVVLVVV